MFTVKFTVQSVLLSEHTTAEVIMNPVMAAGQNNGFGQITPMSEIHFTCTNPAINVQLVPGKVFSVEFHDEFPA